MKSKKVKIKDLKVGMKIKSLDPNTKEIVYKKVTDIWNTTVPVHDQVVLEFSNNCKIRCSTNHPIMVLENNQVIKKLPLELSFDDIILSDNNIPTFLTKRYQDNAPTDYIDITVEDTHTFFAQNDLTCCNMTLISNSQGGVRGGAATLSVPIWHQEIEDILVLKNNKGTEDNRVRRIDYCFQFSGFFYQRYLDDGYITLFSPHDVPDMYEAYFSDQELFAKLYVQYEKNPTIKKKKVKAKEIIHKFLIERAETGRQYFMNVDHVNTHSSFNVPIYMTNLCVEITLHTKPLKSFDDPDAEIALCILAAINMGNIKKLSDLETKCQTAVWVLDQLIDYQQYPIIAAERSTVKRRPLGVGVINFAYYLAKHGVKYSDPAALRLTHEFFEAFQFYLLKASMELAKIKGPCEGFKDTKYAQGILPIDTYKKSLDEIVDPTLNLDWESLRADILKHGLRNSTLSALMPAECQSLSNKILLKDGSSISLGDLIQEHSSVDINDLHENMPIPGQWFNFNGTVELANGITTDSFYYNGLQNVTEIEFEDGNVYRFTNNHLLLVRRGDEDIWVSVADLQENDEVIQF